jgi:hypothetical protein
VVEVEDEDVLTVEEDDPEAEARVEDADEDEEDKNALGPIVSLSLLLTGKALRPTRHSTSPRNSGERCKNTTRITSFGREKNTREAGKANNNRIHHETIHHERFNTFKLYLHKCNKTKHQLDKSAN